MTANYWLKRNQHLHEVLSKKAIEDIDAQLIKYYGKAMKTVVADFERTYLKVLHAADEGREPTPADLYKLDTYWQMQGRLNEVLTKLGDKETKLLSAEFEKLWVKIYEETALKGSPTFNTSAVELAHTMLNASWLADGKTYSQRIWKNMNHLVDTLNDQLVLCVVSGKKPGELVKLLQERFGVSYRQSQTLVMTEIAHIQTEAAAERYKSYGLLQYEFLADPDEGTCEICRKLDKKRFYFTEMQAGVNAPPIHPRDRCTIIPVVDD